MLQNAADYIKRNYARDLTLEEWPKPSTSALLPIHLFKERLGVTFIGYLTKIADRRQAKILSLETNLTIQQIAYMVGYQDKLFLSFSRGGGRTPTQFAANPFGKEVLPLTKG